MAVYLLRPVTSCPGLLSTLPSPQRSPRPRSGPQPSVLTSPSTFLLLCFFFFCLTHLFAKQDPAPGVLSLLFPPSGLLCPDSKSLGKWHSKLVLGSSFKGYFMEGIFSDHQVKAQLTFLIPWSCVKYFFMPLFNHLICYLLYLLVDNLHKHTAIETAEL